MSFLKGCLLVVDGTVAIALFQIFRLLDLSKVGIIGAVIIGIPIWIALIKRLIALIKRLIEEEREKNEQNRIDQEKRKKEREEEKRRSTPCLFQDGISEEEFEILAHKVAKRIKRLRVSVSGPVISCTVDSQSGISTWKFVIDFNDYGHISGYWWIRYRENYDSSIPNRYAELMDEAITERLKKS